MKRKIIIEGFEFQLQRCEISAAYYGTLGSTGGQEITLELRAFQGDTNKEDWARLMEVVRTGKATVVFE
jgi:hypothetical protein